MSLQREKKIFFTLPDNIVLEKKTIKIKLTLKIFFYLFFLFRFFIFKESIYIFESIIFFIFDNINIKKMIIKIYKGKFFKYYYIISLLIFKNNVKIFSNHDIVFNKFLIKDINLYILLNIVNKRINFKKTHFFKINSFIFFFTDFILRIPFILLIAFKHYILKFKIFKFNEYISTNQELNNYPLVKVILKINWKITNYQAKKYISNKNIFFFYTIYFEKLIFQSSKLYTSKLDYYNLINLINKVKLLKFILLFKKNTFIFIYNYFKIYFVNIFYIYIYKIWIFQLYIYNGFDWIEPYKWNIFYLFHLYWWLYKYNFELPVWLYILTILQIINIYLKNIELKYNIVNLVLLKNKKFNFISVDSIIIYRITSIIFITYFEKIYYKFFKLYKTKKTKFFKYRNLLIKYYPIDFVYLPFNFYNNSYYYKNYLGKYIYNIDLLHWKIFYLGKTFDNNSNILSIYKQIKINNSLEQKYIKFCSNIWYNYKRKENLSTNFLFFYNFIRNIFFKIYFEKDLKYINIKYNYIIIHIIKNYYFYWILSYSKKTLSYNNLFNYKNNNIKLYDFIYSKYISLVIYIFFIKKYIRN